MKQKTLRKSEIKEIDDILLQHYGKSFFSKKDHLVLVQDNITYLLMGGMAHFFMWENQWIPTIKYLLSDLCLPTVTVDMGAIKFLVSGADIMRPGVVGVDEITKDAIVAIIDEKNRKPIAIGKVLTDNLLAKTSGKVVKNIHYVGDAIWNL